MGEASGAAAEEARAKWADLCADDAHPGWVAARKNLVSRSVPEAHAYNDLKLAAEAAGPHAVAEFRRRTSGIKQAIRASTTPFHTLGVTIVGGDVFKTGGLGRKLLGPLDGATAEVTDATSRRTLTRVATGVGALTKKTDASAFVIAGNGALHEVKITGAGMFRKAQAEAEAVRFNALARHADGGV